MMSSLATTHYGHANELRHAWNPIESCFQRLLIANFTYPFAITAVAANGVITRSSQPGPSIPDASSSVSSHTPTGDRAHESRDDDKNDWAAEFRKMLKPLKEDGTFYKNLRKAEKQRLRGQYGC